MPEQEKTSATLLGRVRQEPMDGAAWREFVDRYRPRIYAYCRTWSVQPADAEDITQGILLKLVDKLRTFQYDPGRSFRAWLKVVCRHALSDYVSDRRRVEGSGDSAVLRMFNSVEASESFVQKLEEEFDHELLQLAMQRVQTKVSAQQWEAFRLTVLEGKEAAAVAKHLGCQVVTVYRGKSKVQKLVREEIQRLENQS